MPKIRAGVPYDPSDRDSLMEYARKLDGSTLGEWIFDQGSLITGGKGDFGRILESEVFYIENNSDPVPDFEILGIDLKATPLKRKKRGGETPKERLVLSTINYMDIIKDGWDKFFSKNGKLLIVFYLYEEGKDVFSYRIMKAMLWEYSDEDLLVIRDDWDKIADMVKAGRAHELSEGQTMYLGAARKGMGHGANMRPQPYSTELASQRAFSLKQSYIGQIWNRMKDADSLIDLSKFDESRTFEEDVLSRFDEFKGLYTEEIRNKVGPELQTASKSYFASLARRMMGIRTQKIMEFEKAGVMMKTIRLQPNGVPKEDMSFPYFEYAQLISTTWEDSEFFECLNRRFLFIIYQMDKKGVYFKDVMFWSMPLNDQKKSEDVWSKTLKLVKKGEYDGLPKSSENPVSHVRPHGRNRDDTTPGLDGSPQTKKCFWLNRRYIAEQLTKTQ